MANMNDNTTKVYYALDEQMVACHDKDDVQSRRQAEEIAHDLIKNADLPLLIRCRALCVLGCSDEGDYVHHAEQSVYFAKLGLAATQEKGGDDTDGKRILRGCEKGLAAAKVAKAVADAKAATTASTESAEVQAEQENEQDGEEDEEDNEDDDDEQVVVIRDATYEDEEDVDDDGEEELVWHAGWDEERKAEAWAKHDRLEAAAAAAAAGEGDATAASAPQTRGEKAEEAD